MKNQIVHFLLIIAGAFTWCAQAETLEEYDQYTNDQYGYVLNCNGQYISPTRYFLAKYGLVLPEKMGSVGQVIEWMSAQVLANKPEVPFVDYRGYKDTYRADNIVYMLNNVAQRMSDDVNFRWRNDVEIEGDSLGLPEKIESCETVPVWASLNTTPAVIVGKWDLLMSLKPIDQVLIMLVAQFRKVGTSNLSFARALLPEASVTKEAWIRILSGDNKKPMMLPGKVRAWDCKPIEASKLGAFQCRNVQFGYNGANTRSDYAPFTFVSEDGYRSESSSFSELKLDNNSSEEIVFSDDGRLLYITAGTLIHRPGQTHEWFRRQLYVSIQTPFYRDNSRRMYHDNSETLLPVFSPRSRKVFFNKEGRVTLEPDRKTDEELSSHLAYLKREREERARQAQGRRN